MRKLKTPVVSIPVPPPPRIHLSIDGMSLEHEVTQLKSNELRLRFRFAANGTDIAVKQVLESLLSQVRNSTYR